MLAGNENIQRVSLREMNCIMVLEDDENLRELLVDVLDSLDFICEGAANAAEAVVRSEQRTFDIVISDVRMAGSIDGMGPVDGLGALALLKLRRPELKCIVMTGYADDEAPLKALEIQVDDYLYKPFDVSDVLRSVEQIRNAGKRRSYFTALWDKHVARPRLERALENLSQARVQALNGLRVAIRSKQINLDRAWEMWLRWEHIEKIYSRVDMGELEASPAVIQSGIQHYKNFCHDFRLRTIKPGEVPLTADYKPAFRKLYARIVAGEIDVEELLMAAFVRQVPKERRVIDGELQQLYENLWPAVE